MSVDASVAMVVQAAKAANIDLSNHSRLGSKVVVNTCYSGMGCAETATLAVQKGLAQRGISCEVKYHSACDSQQLCAKAASAHKAEHDHFFTNVWDRAPAGVQERLQAKARTLRKAVEQRQAALIKDGVSRPFIASWRRRTVIKLGEKFVDYACGILSKCPWHANTTSYCSKHDAQCRPVPQRSSNECILVEIGGSTCVGWSSMGSNWGWLDDAGGPCLVYLYWVKSYGPDMFMHECTRHFDHKVARRILGDEMHVSVMQHSPSDWGLPVARGRQYMVGASKLLKLCIGSPVWTTWQIPPARDDVEAPAGKDHPAHVGNDESLWQRWLRAWGPVHCSTTLAGPQHVSLDMSAATSANLSLPLPAVAMPGEMKEMTQNILREPWC